LQYPKAQKRLSEGKSDIQSKRVKEPSEGGSAYTDKSKNKVEVEKRSFLAPAKDFKAYDYSLTDYSVFDSK